MKAKQEKQPEIVKPTEQNVSRVLLEILFHGLEENKYEIKNLLEDLQKQIGKSKKSVRILWYVDKGEKTVEEKEQWLIDNAKSKYYVIFDEKKYSQDYVKDALSSIKKFEESFNNLKEQGVKISKR